MVERERERERKTGETRLWKLESHEGTIRRRPSAHAPHPVQHGWMEYTIVLECSTIVLKENRNSIESLTAIILPQANQVLLIE